jgi:AcrR family transcriptional regulator
MVRSAAQLIRRKGVSGTGMREIVSEANAPRGSLQHYFPGGKEELVAEALLWMGGVAARRVRRHADRLDGAPPSALLEALVEQWKVDLTREEFIAGCPLVAAAADSAATSEQLRAVLVEAFGGWQDPFAAVLTELGVPPERAPQVAMLVICTLEGAIILSRIRHDLAPLDALVAEMGPVVDAAVTNARSGSRSASAS